MGTYKLLSDLAVIVADHVLMVKYAGMPDHQKGWFLPHTLVEYLEHPQDAAKRVLDEQFASAGHVAPEQLLLCDVESFEGNDRSWHLPFHYLLRLQERIDPTESSGIAAHEWFPLDALPPRADVAHHGWAIDVIEAVTAP